MTKTVKVSIQVEIMITKNMNTWKDDSDEGEGSGVYSQKEEGNGKRIILRKKGSAK